MQSRRALVVLDELRSLASDDETQLAAAKERLAGAEEELAAARSAFDSASTRAEVSQRVARGAEELLSDAAHARAGEPEPPRATGASQGMSRTLAQELLAFVRCRRRASRTEMAEHLGAVRPDIKLSGLGPKLTELVRKGALVRVGLDVYEIPSPAEGGGA